MIYEQARRILARCPCDHQFAKWPVFCYFSSSVRIPCSPAVSYNLMLPIALRGNTVSTKAGVSTFQDSHLWLYTLCRGAHRELRKGCRKTAQCLRQDINLASTLIFPLINHRRSLCVCVCVCVCVYTCTVRCRSVPPWGSISRICCIQIHYLHLCSHIL